MLISRYWLALLYLIFVLICHCLLILGGMHIVYVMILLLVKYYFVLWKRLTSYKGMFSTFCDYCLLSVHVLIYTLTHGIY